MRITGGDLRSRRLLSIRSEKLRPATDRLRESMFDVLRNLVDFDGARALDLYAGTGSVGFETISRGAAQVVFVEANRKVAAVLRENSKALAVENKCEICVMKVERYLNNCLERTLSEQEQFELVYIDPPYAFNKMTHKIVSHIMDGGILKRSGIVCVEHSREYVPPPSNLFRQTIFGSTVLSFLKQETK